MLVTKSAVGDGMAYGCYLLAEGLKPMDERHQTLIWLNKARALIGGDVRLTDGRVVGKVVECMIVPETLKAQELRTGDVMIGILWRDRGFERVAERGDLKVSASGVVLEGA
jgi:hypothetical protein